MEKSPDILLHDLVCPVINEEDDMDIVSATTDVPIAVVRPPPGFRQFSWPREEWGPDGDPSLFSKGAPWLVSLGIWGTAS